MGVWRWGGMGGWVGGVGLSFFLLPSFLCFFAGPYLSVLVEATGLCWAAAHSSFSWHCRVCRETCLCGVHVGGWVGGWVGFPKKNDRKLLLARGATEKDAARSFSWLVNHHHHQQHQHEHSFFSPPRHTTNKPQEEDAVVRRPRLGSGER